jgi:hypothetical protein
MFDTLASRLQLEARCGTEIFIQVEGDGTVCQSTVELADAIIEKKLLSSLQQPSP